MAPDNAQNRTRGRGASERSRPFHPLFFAIYPVLFLYAHNSGRYAPAVLLRPLAAVLGLALVTWVASALLLRSRSKGALLTTFLLSICFSYGHVYPLVASAWFDFGFVYLGPARVLLVVYLVAISVLALVLSRAKGPLAGLHFAANLGGGLLLAGVLLQIGAALLGPSRESAADVGDGPVLAPPAGTRLPHIYYVILDGYAREDVLADLYGYPENPLVVFLKESGFRVVEDARANYGQTTLSLASSLSMDLLDDLAAEIGTDSEDRQPLRSRIKENLIARLLRPLGYRYVAFASGYYSTEAHSADVFLSPGISLNEFENVLFTTTPFPEVLDILGKRTQERLHRHRILYTLDHLADPLDLGGPVFVVAHVVAPHPPFVFGPDGGRVRYPGKFSLADGDDLVGTRGIRIEEYRRLYRDQLHYLNERVVSGLERLLTHTDDPLLVIVQGDHGPGSRLVWEDREATDLRERFCILNAYYASDGDYSFLYDGITPVNSFRMILNHFFGTALSPLPDRSYFSTESQPYDFSDVTDEVTSPRSGEEVSPPETRAGP